MFWGNFVALCVEHNKKPNPVAKELGISSGAVTSWKNGTVPNSTTVKKLANYFGVSVDYLLGKENKDAVFISYKTDHTVSDQAKQYLAEQSEIKKPIRIPVYGQVAAGIPIEAITDVEDYEELDPNVYHGGDFIALKIHGQSMEPRMVEGDVVIVRLQEDVNNGETAIVMVENNDATCKKIKKTPEGILLMSTNPNYEPIFYSNKEIETLPVRILGKVVELRAKY